MCIVIQVEQVFVGMMWKKFGLVVDVNGEPDSELVPLHTLNRVRH